MENERVREAATARLEDQLTEWAQSHFPGVSDLAWRTVNGGAAGPRQAFTGNWHGLPLEFKPPARSGGRQFAWPQLECQTCHLLVTLFAYHLADGATLATRDLPDEVVSGTVDCCATCAWLLKHQAIARNARTRFQKLLFRIGRNFTAEELLATKPGEAIPNRHEDWPRFDRLAREY